MAVLDSANFMQDSAIFMRDSAIFMRIAESKFGWLFRFAHKSYGLPRSRPKCDFSQ
ncbi:hypothetical protein ACWIUD_02990 [Helicobacter sp. 23-1044]